MCLLATPMLRYFLCCTNVDAIAEHLLGIVQMLYFCTIVLLVSDLYYNDILLSFA